VFLERVWKRFGKGLGYFEIVFVETGLIIQMIYIILMKIFNNFYDCIDFFDVIYCFSLK
jgi:hypothetical protein